MPPDKVRRPGCVDRLSFKDLVQQGHHAKPQGFLRGNCFSVVFSLFLDLGSVLSYDFSCLYLLFSGNQQLAPQFYLSDEMVLHAIYFPFFLNLRFPSWVFLTPLPFLDWMIFQNARYLRVILAGVADSTTVLSQKKSNV